MFCPMSRMHPVTARPAPHWRISSQLGRGMGYVKTQLSCILLYYADDDMFRPLWAIFRSQKMYTNNEISLKVSNMHLYYDHTVYSFPLYTFLRPEDCPQWPKHVISIINRIQDSCVLTYPTPSLIAYNTKWMTHLKVCITYCHTLMCGCWFWYHI